MERKTNETRWWIGLGTAAVVYNVIAFALPFGKTAVFFLSWVFTMAALAAQVYVIRTAFFKGEGIKSKLYGFPIARVGMIYLAVQMVLGLVFMALGTVVPIWLPLVLCVLLMGAALIGLITTEGVREEVERQERKLVKDVSRMRKFQAHTKMLAGEGRIPEAKEPLRELAEAFRYSDPVSSEALKEIEDTIADDLARLQDAVALLKKEKTLELCRKTKRDLEERNQICKMTKAVD